MNITTKQIKVNNNRTIVLKCLSNKEKATILHMRKRNLNSNIKGKILSLKIEIQYYL